MRHAQWMTRANERGFRHNMTINAKPSSITPPPVSDPRRSFTVWSDRSSKRAAIVVFGLVELVAVPMRLAWAHGAWFGIDDFNFLAERKAGNLGDLFRPQFENWSTLIVLVYRFLWWTAGLRYLPFELFAIVLYLAVAALLRIIMRRAGVGPWVATLTASILVLFGAGIENNFFTAVFVFSFLQLFLADHSGSINGRDFLALVAGFAALMCSGLAVTMTLVVGIALLLRRGWRVALLQTAPLGVAYVIWLRAAPKGEGAVAQHARSVSDIAQFVVNGVEATFGRLGQLSGFGFVVAALLVVGLTLIFREGTHVVRERAAVPLAMLAGAVILLLTTAAVRAGGTAQVQALFKEAGPRRARDGRYLYAVATLLLPALALAVDAIIRRWHQLAIVLLALLTVSVPAHIHQFRDDARTFALTASDRQWILSAPRLPLAKELPRGTPVLLRPLVGGFGGSVSLGWLVDALSTGRLPTAKALNPSRAATETVRLVLAPTHRANTNPCRQLVMPIVRVLDEGQLLTLRAGNSDVIITTASGAQSRPVPLPIGTYIALAGPLRLRVAPSASHLAAKTVLCG